MKVDMNNATKERVTERLINEIRINQTIPIDKALALFSIGLQDLLVHLKTIASWGYTINNENSNLSFVSAPDALIDSEISFGLQTKLIGCKVVAFQSVASTNSTAQNLAEQGATEGTIVVSEKQTKGKGRFSRHWYSIEKKGIYCSIILRPNFNPEDAPGLSLMTAVAMADTCKQFTQASVQIKWPNDILLNSKKAAGILTELSAEKNKINHVIIGIGMNINHTTDDFHDEIKSTATSLSLESKTQINRVQFLQKFLVNFENYYMQYNQDRLTSILTKLRDYSSLIGTQIHLEYGNDIIDGKVLDINQDGALLLDCDGEIKTINSGEVTILKN